MGDVMDYLQKTALECGAAVMSAARQAMNSREEVKCDYWVYGCDVFVRPKPERRRQMTYFWLGAEGGM
jgi:hypothetical protein